MRSLTLFLFVAASAISNVGYAQLFPNAWWNQRQSSSGCPGGVCPTNTTVRSVERSRMVSEGPVASSFSDMIAEHDRLHGGGHRWTWPGGTEESLRRHLAEDHGSGVARTRTRTVTRTRGTYQASGGTQASYGSTGSKASYGSSGSKASYGSSGSSLKVGDYFDGGIITAISEPKPVVAPPVPQVEDHTSVDNCPCPCIDCSCGADCDCCSGSKQLLIRKEDVEPCPII